MSADLHPQVRAFLELGAGRQPLTSLSIAQARARADANDALVPAGPSVASIADVSIPAGDGAIDGRVYEDGVPAATIVWCHGGGWVVGGLPNLDAMCRLLCLASGCRVLAVDYRRAPEHPFPGPLSDCWEALGWAAATWPSAPLVVGGDSAGGNLAAVCAVRARDASAAGLALAAQALVYPVTDHDFTTTSYAEYGGGVAGLGSSEMAWYFDRYVPAGVDRSDPAISPLRTPDLSGVAPAVVVIADHDVLRDEGLAYAARLREAGVAVTVDRYDDMAHGFFSRPGLFDTGTEAVRRVGAQLAELVAARVTRSRG